MLLLSNEKGLGLLYKVGLAIDGVIYNFISKLYKIFCDLSESTLFSSESYGQIASNLYVVIGVVMLFVLSYSLLKAIANPDDFSKGDSAFQNIVKNVIVTIVIIALLPTLFRVASYVQVTIVNKNTIGQIILGDYLEDDNINMDNVGASQIAIPIFKAFFHKDSYGEETTGANEPLVSVGPNTSGDPLNLGKSYDEIFSAIESDDSNFSEFRKSDTVINEVKDGTIEYSFPFSTFAGIFVVWVLLLFCIDLGIRVVKLAFYQIIAPVPAMCRILPGSNNKKIWDNWVKVTLATYMEIFIRIGVLYLGVYFIMLVAGTFDNQEALVSTNHSHAEVLIKALIIMGVIAFMRQAPKLISDIFGFDSSNMNLGLKGLTGRLGAGGGALALAGGTAIGAGLTAGVKNFAGASGGIGRRLLSGAAGVTGGATRGFTKGLKSKSFADMRKATSESVQKAHAKSEERQLFRAQHPGDGTIIGGAKARAAARVSNAQDKVKDFLGIDSLEGLKRRKEAADTMQGFYKTMAGYVEDNEVVASYRGAYEAEKNREIDSKVFDKDNYDKAVELKAAELKRTDDYKDLDDDKRKALAMSLVDRSRFERDMNDEELRDAMLQKQTKLKMYDSLIKISTIKAVNDKLSDKNADGTIKDGRFQAVKNQSEVFQQQYGDIDFVSKMNPIMEFEWTDDMERAMVSNNPAVVDGLMSSFKNTSEENKTFFADSERGKIASGAAMAEIAKKIEEKKEGK